MVYIKFLKSLLLHKWYVLNAGRFLGVSLWRLIIHDWTKFLPVEFFRYARNFFGDNKEAAADGFVLAWLHHENSNPHHWGYWIPRTGKSANEPLPMPEVYIREMVADWMGASKTYTGEWDIVEWLGENLPEMRLHSETKQGLSTILRCIGIALTDDHVWSMVEIGKVDGSAEISRAFEKRG